MTLILKFNLATVKMNRYAKYLSGLLAAISYSNHIIGI